MQKKIKIRRQKTKKLKKKINLPKNMILYDNAFPYGTAVNVSIYQSNRCITSRKSYLTS